MYTVVSIQKTVQTYVHSCTCKYIPVVHTNVHVHNVHTVNRKQVK